MLWTGGESFHFYQIPHSRPSPAHLFNMWAYFGCDFIRFTDAFAISFIIESLLLTAAKLADVTGRSGFDCSASDIAFKLATGDLV